MTEPNGRGVVRAVWILALALIVSSLILGGSFYQARHSRATVQVVGMASQPFEADQVKWSLGVGRTVPASLLSDGYVQINRDVESMVAGLVSAGIPRDAVVLQPVTTNPMYGSEGIREYQVNQTLYVVSEDLDAVESLALAPSELLAEGLLLQNSRLHYFYSGLAEVKRTLLARATEDARMRAEEIASATGEGIEAIASARAGVFQITEPFSTDVAAYGIYDTSSRKKEIRVTVHAVFVIH
ncbi:MAG: SIMPL domain-containing protein [marine benthic group bacterium]|jgi:hypothetical protein|nr:SIMPL domain-containing protein [Gemmatimonadota bacterium]